MKYYEITGGDKADRLVDALIVMLIRDEKMMEMAYLVLETAGSFCVYDSCLNDLEPDERECAEAILNALRRIGRCRFPEDQDE